MKVIINPTDFAKETFPEQDLSEIMLCGETVKIGEPVSVTEMQYKEAFAANFPHPVNTLPCKWFSVEIISTKDDSDVHLEQCIERINTHCQLYRLIYAQLTNAKNPVPGAQGATAANAVYTMLAPTFDFTSNKGQ